MATESAVPSTKNITAKSLAGLAAAVDEFKRETAAALVNSHGDRRARDEWDFNVSLSNVDLSVPGKPSVLVSLSLPA